MTDDDKNVLVLTKETFISNEQSMRNQHPLFCLAWDPRELNDSFQDGDFSWLRRLKTSGFNHFLRWQ